MPNFSVDRFESLRRAGKTYSEMEKILGVSRNTLKSYVHTCAHCGQPFYSYPSSHKVYCCRDCYLAGRYGRRA